MLRVRLLFTEQFRKICGVHSPSNGGEAVFFFRQSETAFSGRFVNAAGFHCYADFTTGFVVREIMRELSRTFLVTISIHRDNAHGRVHDFYI